MAAVVRASLKPSSRVNIQIVQRSSFDVYCTAVTPLDSLEAATLVAGFAGIEAGPDSIAIQDLNGNIKQCVPVRPCVLLPHSNWTTTWPDERSTEGHAHHACRVVKPTALA